MDKKNALILNFTANTYHWGCYGTASEIYLSLVDRGYLVNWLDVRTTHSLAPTPATTQDFDDAKFVRRFFDANKPVYHALSQADVVVVNGEGTLHRLHTGPTNLLFLMYAARKFLGKPVHLINHSFFPSGDEQPNEKVDPLYRGVAAMLTRVVPRETASAAVIRRLGLKVEQGFDCLPRFITRHSVPPATTPAGPLVLSGGVNLTRETARAIAQAVTGTGGSGRRICFLTGAKSSPAQEDAATFALMLEVIPELELVDATSMKMWLETMAHASCVISARFHHTIAAAALGTPVVAFPSNTPKVEAICDMFKLHPPIPPTDPHFVEKTRLQVQSALNGQAPTVGETTRRTILDLAENNFSGL